MSNMLKIVSLLAVAAYFTGLVISSAWHELGNCRGQGCVVVPLVVIPFLGVGYALLLPAYIWMLWGRSWWSAALSLTGAVLSFVVLQQYAAKFGPAKLAWSYRAGEWPAPHLLRVQIMTICALLATPIVRKLYSWLKDDELSE